MKISKIALLSLLCASTFAFPNLSSASSFNEEQKKDIESIFSDYLINNPEIIIKSLDKYQADKRKEANKAKKEMLEENYDEIANNKNIPFAGNPDGDAIVIEFFDYNCGYCKKALPDVVQLLEEDKNVKVVFIDLPILGESSHVFAKFSVAANLQGKYMEFHTKLMENRGGRNKETALKLAKEAGLDIEKLKIDAESDKVKSILANNAEIAQKLAITGTPAFIIEKEIIGGYIPLAGIKEILKKARSEK